MILVLQIVMWGSINFWKNYGQVFPWTTDTSNQGYQCLAMSIVIFILLLRKRKIRFYRMIEKISKVSLEIYLISYVFDRLLYHFLNMTSLTFGQKLLMIPLTVGMIFSVSAAAAVLINRIVQEAFVCVKNCVVSISK